MKPTKLFFYGLMGIAIFVITSCNTTSDLVQKEIGTKIDYPCQVKNSQQNEKYFWASQMATSSNMSYSREKALMSVKRRLTSFIRSDVKTVSRRYANEMDVSDKHEFEQKMENETREAAKNTLSDATITCEQTNVLEGGLYRTYIALKVPKKDFLNKLNNGLSREERLQLEYDQKKYREIYNEEMGKLEEKRNDYMSNPERDSTRE